MKQMHTVPCAECPWRTNSIHGWLGGFEPEQYADAVHEGVIPACHLRDEGPTDDRTAFCAGAASVMANACISPKEAEPGQEGARQMVKATGRREDTFIRPERFYVYHSFGKNYVSRFLRALGMAG